MIIYLNVTLTYLLTSRIKTNEEISNLVKQGEVKSVNDISYLKILDK